MVLFEVNLATRKKETVKSNIYIRKRADTTRIKKELQEFSNDFEVMKNESVDGNPSKCKIMCFTTKKDPPKREYVFCGEILEEVDSHPYLGVVLDNKIRWSQPIEVMSSRAI